VGGELYQMGCLQHGCWHYELARGRFLEVQATSTETSVVDEFPDLLLDFINKISVIGYVEFELQLGAETELLD
jgi:hypothetical protein